MSSGCTQSKSIKLHVDGIRQKAYLCHARLGFPTSCDKCFCII